MAKLNATTRNSLPSGDFALPGRRYPVEDKGHAMAACSYCKLDSSELLPQDRLPSEVQADCDWYAKAKASKVASIESWQDGLYRR
jgi:hypothetical protein